MVGRGAAMMRARAKQKAMKKPIMKGALAGVKAGKLPKKYVSLMAARGRAMYASRKKK